MTDTYLEHLGNFYNEKTKFQTKKKKNLSCSGCSGQKEFIETNKELIFTCGSKRGKCGVQIKIQLPEYIHYPSYITELRKQLETHINWDELDEYIDTDKEMKQKLKKHKEIKGEIFKLSTKFHEQTMKKKQESLQRFYTNRIEKTKRCRTIKKNINNQELSTTEKQSLYKEYVILVNDMKKEYALTKQLVEELNPYLEQKPPKITIDNVIKKESTLKQSIDDQVIDNIIEHFKTNDGILTKKEYNSQFRKQTKITWGKKLLPLLQKGEDSWLSDKQDEIGSIIKVPKTTNPDQVELTKEWISYLNIYEGASDEDLSESEEEAEESDKEEGGEEEQEAEESDKEDDEELEPEPEEEPKQYTIKDIKEAFEKVQKGELPKIIWKPRGGEEQETGYLDKLDKRLKTKVKIINKDNQKVKIEISDLVEIITG